MANELEKEAEVEKKCARGHRYWLGDGTNCDRCYNMDIQERALAQDQRRVDLLALDIEGRERHAGIHEKMMADSIENSKSMTDLLRAQNAAFDRIAAALEKLAARP